MHFYKLTQQMVGLTLAVLILSACSPLATPALPTDTPTRLPPSATLTPLPATDTPTPEPTVTPTRGLVRVTSPEEIIGKLRETEVLLSQGSTQEQAARSIGVTYQTY